MKVVNSQPKPKYIVDCGEGYYRIGNVHGTFPKGYDCILDGWHIKDGKVITKGKVLTSPGLGHTRLTNSIIETKVEVVIKMSKLVALISNYFGGPIRFDTA